MVEDLVNDEVYKLTLKYNKKDDGNNIIAIDQMDEWT